MKKWKTPKAKKVVVREDSNSMACQGKMIGCYAGSSCGSVKIDVPPKPDRKPQK